VLQGLLLPYEVKERGTKASLRHKLHYGAREGKNLALGGSPSSEDGGRPPGAGRVRCGRSLQGSGASDRGRDVVAWLSGLGGRRWRRWLLAAVQGEVEAQVGGGPTQGHSVEATVSEGSASRPLVKAVMEMRWMAARRGVDAGA